MLGHLVVSHYEGEAETRIAPSLSVRRLRQLLAALFRRS
jgi:hypothetical protein